jgi:hypothetical protein
MALQQIATRPEAKYNCPVVELYAGLGLVWNSQALYETEFENENTQYTPGLSVIRKAAIDAAQALPDGQASGSVAEVLRIQLVEKLKPAIAKWHSLEGYTQKAFPGELYKPKIEAAGKQFYQKATNLNWEVAKQLLVSAKTFLTENESALTNNGGMPANFITGFDTVKGEFIGLFEAFKAAEQESIAQTDAKLNANNAIYAEGRSMMEDGKRIFTMNAALRNKFVWERVLELLTPNSSTTKVFEANINMGEIASHDMQVINPTAETMVLLEITGNSLQLSANSVDGPVVGPTQWSVPVGDVAKPLEEFATLIGASDVNHFLKLTWPGPGTGTAHYKIRFTHLA